MEFHDLMSELESMATCAIDDQVDEISVQKWQSLFGYSHSAAQDKIKSHRADISRNPLSDTQWDLIRTEKEAVGYDKEAYEHSLSLLAAKKAHQVTSPSPSTTKKEARANINAVRKAGRDDTLTIVPGRDSDGEPTNWCIVSGTIKSNIIAAYFTPFFVPYKLAEKDLSRHSHHPTLGIDATLPQYRLDNGVEPSPGQGEYPVWYFFYGTLMEPEVIARVVGDMEPVYRRARVRGGKLTTWEGKYKALEEESLRAFETDRYEVVRCGIEMLEGGEKVKGLTFRFVGD
ncbi:hypothetical protein B0T16DRAFT_425566 [Cercophora newfieldiana]|uniref:Gamma-glutamylcyclotransferase AIG2-like domain-containing protein n=1 Tax=Cercophora newfieldiana TaxID=92897 RepID=A0AA39YTS2_9PEZI|nr:hypothetical protein B0T16DRAFT_425566 [Cercophora newfieldiana]